MPRKLLKSKAIDCKIKGKCVTWSKYILCSPIDFGWEHLKTVKETLSDLIKDDESFDAPPSETLSSYSGVAVATCNQKTTNQQSAQFSTRIKCNWRVLKPTLFATENVSLGNKIEKMPPPRRDGLDTGAVCSALAEVVYRWARAVS